MLFSWLARRRRAKLLATPFPDEWLGYLERNVSFYAKLNERDQATLRDTLRVLVAEKNWEGCGGLEITDEVKVTVAAQAALLLLGIEHDYYSRVLSILVYRTGFRSPDGWQRADGVVDESVGALGQAWYDGPVILAWDSALDGGRNAADGRNVVLHEFAHQLDFLDGVADGTPVLRRRGDYAQWQEVMTREYERLKTKSARVLDKYGATNPAEFFAVATEAFFEKSQQMSTHHPELYAVLKEYYGQDPVTHERSADDPPAPAVKPVNRKPRRTSRKAAKVEVHARVAREWPWWVQMWKIHPGVSRTQAREPMSRVVLSALGFLLAAIVIGVTLLDYWYGKLALIFTLTVSLLLTLLAVGLWCAMRWVDRHGQWGGTYYPASPVNRKSSVDEPAPPVQSTASE